MRNNKMIVIDGVDGSGKGVQTRLLHQTFIANGLNCILTREPGGSPAAEQIRELLVNGEPETWDSMTELLLMVAARRAHLRDTIWPALDRGDWIISDRFADSSRAFQGIAGNLGLDTVDAMHKLAIDDFKPDLVLILDVDEQTALDRTVTRNTGEDRFERKGLDYHHRVRAAFREIATSSPKDHVLIDAAQPVEAVRSHILEQINSTLQLDLEFRQT